MSHFLVRYAFLVCWLLIWPGVVRTAEKSAPAIAVTVDDLPFVGPVGQTDSREVATDRILAALVRHKAPATGFVVAGRVPPEAPILRRWLRAGFELGNHSNTHPNLNEISLEEFENEVITCSRLLKKITGKSPRFFRYPMLQQGSTVERRDGARAILERLILRTAHVSVDTGEYVLVKPYVAALRAGNSTRAKEIGRAYLEHLITAVRHYREVARSRTGREVNHILLLHANALAADYLDDLLEALKSEGLRFITLEQALADPVYSRKDDYVGRIGLSWLYRFEPAMDEAWAWDNQQVKELQER